MGEAEGFVQISPTFLPLSNFRTLIVSAEYRLSDLKLLINIEFLVYLNLLSSLCDAYCS